MNAKRSIKLSKSERFLPVLQAELERRCEKNPSYSLRAFAKFLGLHPACLSVILKGKRPLTQKMILKLAAKLELSPAQRAYYTSDEKAPKEQFDTYPMDVFQILSHWYYDAMLELARVEDFDPSPRWIAKILGLSVAQVTSAIKRMERCGLIRIHEDGTWTVLRPNMDLIVDAGTTPALRGYQAEVLGLSQKALEKVPPQERLHSSMTMAINVNDMEEAKEALRKFKRDFCSSLQERDSFNSVYQLNIGFYPIGMLTGEMP